MPEETIASAVSRTSDSETLQPNLFQLFQPIGGVFASPSNFWPYALEAKNNRTKSGRRIRLIKVRAAGAAVSEK
jgi:hypothetical protein